MSYHGKVLDFVIPSKRKMARLSVPVRIRFPVKDFKIRARVEVEGKMNFFISTTTQIQDKSAQILCSSVKYLILKNNQYSLSDLVDNGCENIGHSQTLVIKSLTGHFGPLLRRQEWIEEKSEVSYSHTKPCISNVYFIEDN